MSAAGRFALYPASFTDAAETPQTLDLTYIQQAGLNPGSRVNRVAVSGAIDPGANLLASADPMIPFQSRSIAALLGAVNPTTGLKLSGGVLRYQQRDDSEGVFATGSVHVTETFGAGYLLIDSITASQDDEQGAVAQGNVYVQSSDGLTNPITRSVAADISSVSPAFGTEYYLGPVYYNTAQIPGVKQVSVNFGVRYDAYRASGAVFPTSGCVVQRQPVLRVVCNKLSADAAASVFLRSLAGAFTVYLRKATDAGIRVADATTQHAKFSASAGAWHVESIEGNGLDDATVTFVCLPTTNISYSVASAIS